MRKIGLYLVMGLVVLSCFGCAVLNELLSKVEPKLMSGVVDSYTYYVDKQIVIVYFDDGIKSNGKKKVRAVQFWAYQNWTFWKGEMNTIVYIEVRDAHVPGVFRKQILDVIKG